MNKKVKTITTWLAAAIFLLALAINIKVTLDDPFVMLSDEAIAQTTGTDTSGTGEEPNGHKCKEDDCTVTIGVPPFETAYHGHYWHCGNGIASDNCINSECWKDCDAYKFND